MSFTDIGTLTARKADSLAYTQAEVNDIISKFSSNSFDLDTDKNALMQRLEFLYKKEISLQLHSDTLIEYLKVKRIPRGLRLGIKPTLCKEDTTHCKNWEKILNKCSLDLMTLTVEGVQTKLMKLRVDINVVKQKLQAALNEGEMNNFETQLRDMTAKHKSDLLKVKMDKFKRDTIDYQEERVYNWKRPFIRKRQYSKTRSVDSEGASGSENSDTSSSSFLDRGTRGKPGEGGKGKKGTKEPVAFQMSTRTKVR
ncbi:uncharacterized protein LOC121393672 [Xenopus laevis]|uniref:Uncharacterized protein LOC121393672 n=1 Tax=Xenopus laevis TaxID=8355 RepID=A0A8J1KPP6_XENLA|nr:uncharacterized protein LOC121393672 [Xenopus laevis]